MENSFPAYEILAEKLTDQGFNLEATKSKLKNQHIETPSWGYGNSGTRFKVFSSPGAARNITEKLEDAAYINSLCGIAPSVALHIPWDMTDDWKALSEYANSLNIEIGAINPNVFQDDIYKLGSLCNASEDIRKEAVKNMLDCIVIMEKTGSKILSIWLADGTNYAGQDNIRDRKSRLEDSLVMIYNNLPDDCRLLLEYKFFEPGFYHTDLSDWGTSYAICKKLGNKAEVLVDMGHHAMGTNVPHIVAFLLDEQKLGGFHLNARHYADDDLIVGSDNPWELFLVYNELVDAGHLSDKVAFMIDQSHNIEPKLEAVLLSVLNCQEAYAKALIVNRAALKDAQLSGDVLGAHCILRDAFQTDVRPLLAQIRIEMDLPVEPLKTLKSSDYLKKVIETRGTSLSSGSSYQAD